MKGARILIVEDEKIVAKTLERWLQEIGYVVTAVIPSATGEVTITTRLDGEDVECTVHDTGIGIAQETVPLLFAPFRQADDSTTRRYGELGLGLYSVWRLLDLLAGTISVSGEVGKGSQFRVWVPREVGERTQPASPPQARSSPT